MSKRWNWAIMVVVAVILGNAVGYWAEWIGFPRNEALIMTACAGGFVGLMWPKPKKKN